MDSRSKTTLVHLLIAKSIAEALLVGSLVVGFYLIAFPPRFQGWGEATPSAIAGWVVNRGNAGQRVEVQLFIDDKFVATALADQPRPDVVTAGYALDERHGYTFAIPSLEPGAHAARVYAVHSSGSGVRKTLQLVGSPILFNLDAKGFVAWQGGASR